MQNKNKHPLALIDKKYYFAFAVGTLILVVTIVFVSVFDGNFLGLIFYPMLIFSFFTQIMSGFGFIIGYIPIAQKIINWLTKTSKKKPYSQKKIKAIEKELEKLKLKEEKQKRIFEEKESKLEDNHQLLNDEKSSLSSEQKEIELRKNANEKEKLLKEKKEFQQEIQNKKEDLQKEIDKHRSKFEERIIDTQEEIYPQRFKLIMIIPIYLMTIVGVLLTIAVIVKAILIINLGSGVETNTFYLVLDTFERIIANKYYKGVMSVISVLSFYIIPSVKKIRNPEVNLAPKDFKGKRRKLSDWWKKRVTRNFRGIINDQFEDLERHYWEIIQTIGKYLLIPIGLAEFIIAPLGSMTIVLGYKFAIKKQKLQKYELILQIVIACFLLGMILILFLPFMTTNFNNIHPSVNILSQLIYGVSLLASFLLFTRMEISKVEKI
ncbi:MAG: hypothetical protein GNW80_09310 [Asgard group archaeon]|nr:hypothetical protein [Asgard group archaeon]